LWRRGGRGGDGRGGRGRGDVGVEWWKVERGWGRKRMEGGVENGGLKSRGGGVRRVGKLNGRNVVGREGGEGE